MIRVAVDPLPSAADLDGLFRAAWGNPAGDYSKILPRSLVHLGADEGDRLVGFVNVAWDGGKHAFLLDTSVHPDMQRQGLATRLVKQAAELAGQRGAEWLHVDYEPHLAGFHEGCGFRQTGAALIQLK